jgi:hypothetical protein
LREVHTHDSKRNPWVARLAKVLRSVPLTPNGLKQPSPMFPCLNRLRLEAGDSRLQTRVPSPGGEGTLVYLQRRWAISRLRRRWLRRRRTSITPWRKHIVRMTSQRKRNGSGSYCRLFKPGTLGFLSQMQMRRLPALLPRQTNIRIPVSRSLQHKPHPESPDRKRGPQI